MQNRESGAKANAIAEAILAALRSAEGHELAFTDLRDATAETRSRYGGTHRFTGALGLLERADLIWILDREHPRKAEVGLTQRAIAIGVGVGLHSSSGRPGDGSRAPR